MKKMKIFNYKEYIIWFIIWLGMLTWYTYASSEWTIWHLFEKVWTRWYLVWNNIKNLSITRDQLWTDSVITSKILNWNVTEEKLSTSLQSTINSAIQTETDPLSVRLTWNQTVSWVKFFDSLDPVIVSFRWVNSGWTSTNPLHIVSAQRAWLSTWRYDLAFLLDTWAARNFYMKTTWWRFILNTDNVNAEIIDASVRMSSITPTANNHVATKWYVDWLISNLSNNTYTYSWQSSPWSSCVNSMQVRSVNCVRNDLILEIDSRCTWVKPQKLQSCVMSL